jgi:hypothetical protein
MSRQIKSAPQSGNFEGRKIQNTLNTVYPFSQELSTPVFSSPVHPRMQEIFDLFFGIPAASRSARKETGYDTDCE